MTSILVVDDEPRIREALARVLDHAGYAVCPVGTGGDALEACARQTFDLALLDITLPDMSGIDVLRTLRARGALMPCVFVTASDKLRTAVEAMQAGGYDYITKPFDNAALLLTVDRALEFVRLGQRVTQLEEDLKNREAFSGIVGESPALREVLRQLTKAAATDVTVLLTGESGTGKELAARSLHRQSRRAGGPFVSVNCAAIPSALAESEFFGAERGAFTDAHEARAGLFERAHRGTLFLDEIGDLPIDIQAKLLRVLQDREVTRLGGHRACAVDVRVVGATNQDLQRAMANGRFRSDVFWRVSVFPVNLPALRDRREDLPMLTTYLIDRLNLELGTGITGVADAVQEVFAHYDWPGNVRELENVLRYAMIMADGQTLQRTDFPSLTKTNWPDDAGRGALEGSLTEIVARATARLERAAVEAALARHGGNRTAAAAALGIGRRTLFTKLRQWRLIDPERPDDEDH